MGEKSISLKFVKCKTAGGTGSHISTTSAESEWDAEFQFLVFAYKKHNIDSFFELANRLSAIYIFLTLLYYYVFWAISHNEH